MSAIKLGFNRPTLSLDFTPEPVSIIDELRTRFEYLNKKMFEQIKNPNLNEMMTNILNKCLLDLKENNHIGKIHSCERPIELKLDKSIVSNNFFIGSDHYTAKMTGVHVYSCDGFVYKKTSFFIKDIDCFFKLVLEICLQQYAFDLECGIKIPEIYDYILSQDGSYLSLEIKMEKIELIDVKNEMNTRKILQNHESLISTIKSGLDCFERNGLYHNDSHSDNIGFYEEGGVIKVVLMDFGKATLTDKNRYQSPSGFYKEIEDKDSFSTWVFGTTSPNKNVRRTFYGGRRKKRVTKNRRNRKSKYTNKQRRRR
jgi:hypothetical protein